MIKKKDKNLGKIYAELGDMRYDPRNKNLASFISREVKGDSILDIGCGSGNLISVLEKEGKKVFGIEQNEGLIKLGMMNENIIKGDAENIDKLFKEKVSGITLIDLLEHIKNDKALISKCFKFLNVDGMIIVLVPAFRFLYGKRDKTYGHYRRYSKKEVKNILEENHFKIIKMRYWNMIGFLPYFFYEKALNKKFEITELRTKNKNFCKVFINRLLDLWFKYVENNINFGFGLSLLCVAKKIAP